MSKRFFTVYVVFLLASLLAAEPKEEKKPLSPLTRTLKRLLIDFTPGITDADPSEIAIADFEKNGITAGEVQRALEELARRYPFVQKRIEKGNEQRREYSIELDKDASQILTKQAIDRSLPSDILASLLKLKNQMRKPIEVKLPLQKVETLVTQEMQRRKERGDDETELKFAYPRIRYRIEDYTERRYRTSFDDWLFDEWHNRSIERIERALVHNYRAALSVAIEPGEFKVFAENSSGKKTKLTKEDISDLKLTPLFTNGGVTYRVGWKNQAVEIVTSDTGPGSEIIPSAKATHPQSDGRPLGDGAKERAALRRLALLSQTLVELRQELDSASSVPLMEKNLRRVTAHHRARRQGPEALTAPKPSQEPLGENFNSLLWQRFTSHDSGGVWENRPKRARRWNPFAQSLEHSVQGHKIRPGFFRFMIPYVLALETAWFGGKAAYEDGYLDPLIHRAQSVANQVDQRTADVLSALDVDSEVYRPPGEGDTGVSSGSPSNGTALFRADDSYRVPDQLELVYASDLVMEKTFPLQLKAEKSIEAIIHTARPQIPIAGMVGVPLPTRETSYTLAKIEVKNQDGIILAIGTDYEMRVTPFGIPVLRLFNPSRDSQISFKAEYGKAPPEQTATAHFIDPKHLHSVVHWADEAGFVFFADSLKSLVSSAEAVERQIKATEIEELWRDEARYTYHPPDRDKPINPENPFGPLKKYLNSDGRLCYQCGPARDGLNTILKAALLGEEGIEKITSAHHTVNRDGKRFNLPTHTISRIIDEGGSYEDLDGTPQEKDPRAPKPLSKGERLSLSLSKWFRMPSLTPERSKTPVAGASFTSTSKQQAKQKRADHKQTPPVQQTDPKTKGPSKKQTFDEHKKPAHTNFGAPSPSGVPTTQVPQILMVKRPLPARITSDNHPEKLPAHWEERPELPLPTRLVATGSPPDQEDFYFVWTPTPDLDQIKKLEAALSTLLANDVARSMAKRHPMDDLLPHRRVTRVINTLIDYYSGNATLHDLEKTINSFTNEKIELSGSQDIPKALSSFEAMMTRSVQKLQNRVHGKEQRDRFGIGKLKGIERLLTAPIHEAQKYSWGPRFQYIVQSRPEKPVKMPEEPVQTAKKITCDLARFAY